MELPTALYVPTDDGSEAGPSAATASGATASGATAFEATAFEATAFEATALTIGPWDAGSQHAGPPAALLARAVERASAIEGGQTVRLAYDILAPVPVGPVRISTTTVRPGRRIELLEAVLAGADDRPLMRLTAWRMRMRTDGATPADSPPVPVPVGPAESRPESAAFFSQEIAYHRALDWRFAAGTFNAPGPAAAWTRPACSLVEGEPMSPLEHLLVMTDAASGISASLDWQAATFANVDLTVALQRPPRGEWLGMDATTVHGGTGAAQAYAVLFDAEGTIGRSAQSLFVEPR